MGAEQRVNQLPERSAPGAGLVEVSRSLRARLFQRSVHDRFFWLGRIHPPIALI
jgi:hypothetical protein